ncbi:eCIS core domain-containing protein [Bradyrhizobium oligotrophicum]|uniref:eCIS core domain-containing protein n=1 Tax=Bradyrhizobium oligotrophicum TaxID=44255 RepID=UPI003EB80E46
MKAAATKAATPQSTASAQRPGMGVALQPPSPLLQPLQPRLEIGAVDDPAEREAEAVAHAVADGPAAAARVGTAGAAAARRAPALQRQCECGGTCASCRDEKLRREATQGGDVSTPAGIAPPIVHEVLRAPGQPLERAARSTMESRFGQSFAGVRIHTDARAAASARAVGARAYTVGHNVVFGAGHYSPASSAGQRLLAHELAHVVQQRGERTVLRRAPDYDKMSIDQLRKLVSSGDKAAVEALQNRYAAMSDGQLAQYAKGTDELAAHEYARRVIKPTDAAGQGRFSQNGMQDVLTKDIRANRSASGITRVEPHAVAPDIEVQGGTVGAARTDIPGLENRSFVGQSKLAGGPGYNAQSNFPPHTNPETLPHTHGHAEQHIADQLEEALAKIPRDQLKGRRVWMLIEQEVCATCGQGATNAETAAGVLKKLSLKYPELTFEIKNLQSSSLTVLKGSETAVAAAEGAQAVSGAPSGNQATSVQVETKVEVVNSVRNANGTTVSEVRYSFGKNLEQVNTSAPAGAKVPAEITIRITQNADGSIAAVESLSGEPQALVEALAQKTLAGASGEAGALEGAAEGAAAAANSARRMALLFKGLKIGGIAAFTIITGYQLYTATPKQRPRVLAGAAGGLAGGALGSYVVCNLLLDIETAGWGLLICGLIVGGGTGYLSSKGSEAAYDAATETELDRAYKQLGGKRPNEIGIYNILIGRMGSDGCVDAAFVTEFMRAFPEDVTDAETVLIAAQLADASIQGVPPVARLPAPTSYAGRDDVCPSCHGRLPKDLPGPKMTPAEVEALNRIPTCSSVTGQALAALRSAVKNLPQRPRNLPAPAKPQPVQPRDPNAHPSPPGYKPPDPNRNAFPTVQEQLGTVCPNCHAPNRGQEMWKDFGFGKDPKNDEATRKFLQDWLSK